MIVKAKHIGGFAGIQLFILIQIAGAQTHSTKTTGSSVKPGLAIANYISHEISKNGAGDHGIFFDTLRSQVKPTDLVNPAGRQYQDVKVTLDAGDVIKASLSSNSITPMSLALLGNVTGRLAMVKAIIDTAYSSKFNLFYKADAAGIYTLRITCKKRAPKDKADRAYYYENDASFNLDCIIAAPASGIIADNPTVCDQLRFLLRQRLTNFMQITGALSDTTMDVLDKKKIQSVNYLSTFSFYKNSVAKVDVDPGHDYVAFDQSLLYNSDADAMQAQRYFIAQFKSCLGPDWAEETESNDANWHKFTKKGSNAVSVIFYAGYKYVQILL